MGEAKEDKNDYSILVGSSFEKPEDRANYYYTLSPPENY